MKPARHTAARSQNKSLRVSKAKVKSAQSQRAQALLILGMHRSGTSAFARVVSLLGAALPKNILGANPTNEAGHWESVDLMVIHDDLLTSAGSRWDDWSLFNPDWIQSSVAEGYREKLLGVLQNDFEGSPLFVIKDPRICRFVPLWLDVLERFGAATCVVIPVRNPLEVAASHKRRTNLLPAKSHLLWLRHVLDAEKATRHLPRAIVTYGDLLDDWRGVVGAVTAKTGLHWPRRSDQSELEIDQFLAEALHHHVADDVQLSARADIVDWVKETHHLLQQMAHKRATAEQFERLDRIHFEFDKACATFGLVLAAEAEQSASQLRSVEALVKTREEEIVRLSGELVQVRSAADEAQAASTAGLAQAAALAADLNAARAEGERQRAELIAALEGEKAAAARATEQAAGLQRQAEALRAVVIEREAAAAKLTADVDAARSIAQRHQAERDRLAAAFEEEKAAAAQRKSEIDKLTAAVKSGQAAIRDRERDIDAARLYLRDSQAEVQRLAGELDGARTEIERANDERQRVAERLQEGHDALTLTATDLPAVRCKIAVLEAALKDLRQETGGEVDRIQESASALQSVATQAAQAAAALRAEVREKDELATALAASMRASREDAASQAVLIRDLKAHLEVISAEKDRLAEELAKAAAEIRRVEKSAADHAPALDTFRTAALAESENRAQAQIRTLRDRLIDAESALAKAKRERKEAFWVGPFSESSRAARALKKSGLVDAEWYLREYPEVAKSGRAPAEHYVAEGYARGYQPNPFFDTRWYLERYEDVRRSGKNPLLHYIQYGAREGRDPGPNFQTIYYLENNPDVRGNGINPLVHYLRHGRHEGRLPAPRE